MGSSLHIRAVWVGLVSAVACGAAWAAGRTWTDAKGKYTIQAELIEVTAEHVVLKKNDGKTVTVPLAKLSAADQKFAAEQLAAKTSNQEPSDTAADRVAARKVVTEFFDKLQEEDRSVLGELLTAAAKKLLAAGSSPVSNLPKLDSPRSVRVGKATIDDDEATVTAKTQIGGANQDVKFMLRREANAWKIRGVSATVPGGEEQTVDFEEGAATALAGESSIEPDAAPESGGLPDPAAAAAPPVVTGDEPNGARDLTGILEPIRQENKLPALAAAVVEDGRVSAVGAVGVRRAGGTERVGVDDQFHIGSCTKSMTATLCAILVEQGKLKWDSSIGEVFSDQADKILPAYHDVTLEQLLMHRSGMEDSPTDSDEWKKVWSLTGPMLQQRRSFVELALAEEPAAAPGTKFAYSNYGYTIAGAMCERVTVKTWEDLMRDELFAPLDMTTAGFGPPGDAEKMDQPWGHRIEGAAWEPIPPGPNADNPAVIGPAGTVHCSLADWAKYAAFHLRGARGEEPRLPAEAFQELHTPLAGDTDAYAYGWLVVDRPWAGGKALTHAGSNTMWTAVIWLAPNRSSAYLAATNVASDTSNKACDEAITKLIELSPSP